MNLKLWLVGVAAIGAMTAACAASADTDLIYSFDSGSTFDLSSENAYAPTGTFVYDVTSGMVTDVHYDAVQTGVGPTGPFDFTMATTVSPSDVIFTGDGFGDGTEYLFAQSLALGGTDTITGGNYYSNGAFQQSVTASGSVTETGTATPEPATWALLFAGLAGLGAALRQRRGLAFV